MENPDTLNSEEESLESPSQEPRVPQLTQVQDNSRSKKFLILMALLIVAILMILGLTTTYIFFIKDSTSVTQNNEPQSEPAQEMSTTSTTLKDNNASLRTFQNEYFTIKHPSGWQFEVVGNNYYLNSNKEYEIALHPAGTNPIRDYKLPINIDEVGDLFNEEAEGLYINIEDNIVYLTISLPPEEYAKSVKLSGKPSLNVVGMPVAKNIYRENVSGKEYVSQWVSLPLYRNAEARWLLVIYRVPANEFNEEIADTVIQSLALNKEFWKTLSLEEAQSFYNQHAEELKKYTGGKFITGEDLLKDEYIDIAVWLGLRDPK